jgi:SAM-dependent methyltransferase
MMNGTYRIARTLARKTLSLARNSVYPDSLDRRTIAARYLRGTGIEIGALHVPLPMPPSARVKYVDRMSEAELRQQYPELNDRRLVQVDIIDDGERLEHIPAASQDFVVANHLLEHCQNPIGAIRNMLRVLKAGGILYLCVPDKRYTFDIDRPVTPIEHLLRDDEEGPEWSRRQHFEEWVRLVRRVPEGEVEEQTAHLMETDYSIHYHVWTQVELLKLISTLRDELRFGFEVELFLKREYEVVLVLRKRPGAETQGD